MVGPQTSCMTPNLEEDQRMVSKAKVRNTELINAVLKPSCNDVQSLLSSGVSPMVRCQHSMATVLHIAAARGQEQILRLLVNKCLTAGDNQPLRARDSHGRQPHHVAAANGELNILKIIFEEFDRELINSRVDTKLTCKEGDVKEDLLDSIFHDHFEVTNMLPKMRSGSTALHAACRRSHEDMVRYLLGKEACVNIEDDDKLYPMDVVGLDLPPTGLELCETLGSHGGSVPSSPKGEPASGRSLNEEGLQLQPLTLVFADQRADSCHLEVEEDQEKSPLASAMTMDLLMRSKGRMNMAHNNMVTASIHRFVLKRDMSAIRSYLNSDGSVFVRDEDGLTPIHLAVMHGLREPLRLLLSAHGDAVNAVDSVGKTPLHMAVEFESGMIIEILLAEKVDLRIQAENAETVLHVAARKKNEKIAKALFNRNDVEETLEFLDKDKYTPLHTAVKWKNEVVVKLILEKCRDKITLPTNANSVIHLAVQNKNPNILKLLMTNREMAVGLNKLIDNDLHDPLHLAVDANSLECFEFLIDKLKNENKYRIEEMQLDYDGHGIRASKSMIRESLSINMDKLNICCSKEPTYRYRSIDEKRSSVTDHLLVKSPQLNIKRVEHLSRLFLIAALKGRLEIIRMILKKSTREDTIRLLTVQDKDGRVPLILAAMNGHAECITVFLKLGANLAAKDSKASLTAVDHMYLNVPNSVQIIDDVMDYFMEVTDSEEREDSPEFSISMDYKFLLADKKQDGRQLGVVEAFLINKHDRLRNTFFLHPLTESFLYYKWKQLRLFFFLVVFIFLLHLIALTSYSLCTHVYFNCFICSKYFYICCIIFLMLSLLLIIIMEVLTFWRSSTYMADSETWVKWVVVIFSAVSIIPGPQSRSLAAVTVLVSWLHLFFLVARVQKWGLHVIMFLEVAKNVWQVASKFGFLLLGFAFSFLILFETKHPYEGMGKTMAKVVVMMVELDYAGTFAAEDPEQDAKGLAIDIVGRLLYLGFVVLVVMVLNNLINGMCVSDIAELERQGRSLWLEKQASSLILIENLWKQNDYKSRQALDLTQCVKVFPNRKYNAVTNPMPLDLRRRVLLTVRNREEVSDQCRIESIAEDVKELKQVVKEMKESLHNS